MSPPEWSRYLLRLVSADQGDIGRPLSLAFTSSEVWSSIRWVLVHWNWGPLLRLCLGGGYCVLEEAVVEEADTRVLLSLALTASRIRVTSIENMSYIVFHQVESNAHSSSPLSISENNFNYTKCRRDQLVTRIGWQLYWSHLKCNLQKFINVISDCSTRNFL